MAQRTTVGGGGRREMLLSTRLGSERRREVKRTDASRRHVDVLTQLARDSARGGTMGPR